MGGYLALPAAWWDDEARLREWIDVALKQVGTLPPKQPKARKAAG